MELRIYLAMLRRWWWLLVLVTVVPALAVYGYTKHQPRTYQAAATLLVNVTSTGSSAASYNDALTSLQWVKTYSQMAGQAVVLGPVIQQLGLHESVPALSSRVTVAPYRDTQLMTITVNGTNREELPTISNTIAKVFIQQQDQRLQGGQAANAISVAQPAVTPTAPTGPKAALDTAVTATVAFIFALGLIFLLEYLDDTVKTTEDLKAQTNLEALGVVRRFNSDEINEGPQQLLDAHGAQTPSAEAYRVLCVNLEFSLIDQPDATLLVTSARPREGKSTTVANLAIAFARMNKRVIVVDADLRRPSQHKLFGLGNNQGITSVLLGRGPELEERTLAALQPTATPNLQVLTSGPLPPNPAEIISSARFGELIAVLRNHTDIVLMDSAPVTAVADSLFLAQRATATVLVVDAGHTRANAITTTLSVLEKSNTRVIGAVLNKVHRRDQSYYYYYGRRYGYGPYGSRTNGRNGSAPQAAEPVGSGQDRDR